MKRAMNRTKKTLTVSLTSLLTLSACSPVGPVSGPIGVKGTESRLIPRPSDAATERAQLARFRGQASFLNLESNWGRAMPQAAAGAPSSAEARSDSKRAEQESDVFKVGKPGSKLLYLLNNYRGLQVVSFEDGADKPKLVGRVRATGNSPDEMYYDQANDRLIAIEHAWNTDDDGSYKGMTSRLLVYDVKDAAQPRLANVISLEGRVADSRIVGEVLYVATNKENKGEVLSYSLANSEIKLIARHTLKMRVSQAENMNIVSVQENGAWKYYLVATLSESGWGWWDRSSVIEVVDVSNEKGEIKPLMSVAAKGVIRERSQTLIKDRTLIVTSNYFLDGTRQSVARIAVETFKFPELGGGMPGAETSEVIDENEAQYRKLHIDREIKNLSGQEREQALERLMTDKEIGLRGRFLRTAEGELRKMMPDSVVTVGDGSGLSANLQDVRYEDGLLYAFWVPANEIDPFDLFDISNPREGVRHISRLHFDGWISRAFPFNVQGRRFVLGLGWVVPVVNNETGRRQPQAMIFEVKKQDGRLRAVDLKQYTFEGSNVWSNFNGQDKEIEVRVDSEGRGEVLFSASRYDQKTWSDGGQILKFDLGAIVQGKEDEALKPGPYLSGGSDWIRRVFTNSEIDRINSFSDRKLATFGTREGMNAMTLEPIHMLELARMVRAYTTVGTGENRLGVQVITESEWPKPAQTVLRLVNPSRADEEKPGVLSELTLEGDLMDQFVEPETGDLIVATSKWVVQTDPGAEQAHTRIHLTRVGLSSQKTLEVKVQTSLVEKYEPGKIAVQIERGFRPYYAGGYRSLLKLDDGSLLLQSGSDVHRLRLNDGLSVSPVDLGTCQVKDREDLEVRIFNGKMFFSSKETFDSKEYKDKKLSRTFLAKAELKDDKLACGTEMNVPGRVVAVTPTGEILSEDTWVQDFVPTKREVYRPVREGKQQETETETYLAPLTRRALVSLDIKDDKAVLVDEREASQELSSAHQIEPSVFARVVKSDVGESALELQFLSLAEDATIESETYGFEASLGKDVRLLSVMRDPKNQGSWLGMIRAGKKVQALAWSGASKRPTVLKLKLVDEKYNIASEATDVVQLPEQWDSGSALHFSPEQRSFELVHGLGGISQILLAE